MFPEKCCFFNFKPKIMKNKVQSWEIASVVLFLFTIGAFRNKFFEKVEQDILQNEPFQFSLVEAQHLRRETF